MILELVTFQSPAGWDRARVLDDAKTTIPKWTANRELVRKHFLLGIGETEGTGAGVYLWPSVEAARRAHDEAWRESVKLRTGGSPTIRYFDLLLLVDNEQGRVTEWSPGGDARVLPLKQPS
jgi:hypothetical protein